MHDALLIKLVAHVPVAGLAGGEFEREVGLDGDGVGVGPDGAFAGDEARREGHAGERGVIEREREFGRRREREQGKLAVVGGDEGALERQGTISGEGKARVGGERRADGEGEAGAVLREWPEWVSEPLEVERGVAEVGEFGGGGDRAVDQPKRTREGVAETGGAVAGVENELGGRSGYGGSWGGCNRPLTWLGERDVAGGVGGEGAGADRDAVGAGDVPSERGAVAGAVAEGFGEALGVERRRAGRGIFGTGKERVRGGGRRGWEAAVPFGGSGGQGQVVDLPDETSVAEACAEVRGVGGVGGIEDLDAKVGVGEVEHGGRGGEQLDLAFPTFA